MIFEQLKHLGWHGALGLLVILTVIFIAVFGWVYRPDHALTEQVVQVLLTIAAGIGGAAVMAFKSGSGGSS